MGAPDAASGGSGASPDDSFPAPFGAMHTMPTLIGGIS